MKKKYLFLSVILIAVVCIIVSCQESTSVDLSHADNDGQSVLTKDNLAMIDALDAFNKTLEVSTRSNIEHDCDDFIELQPGRRIKWWKVALADAVGGVVGGFLSCGSGATIGAVFASAAYAFNDYNVTKTTTLIPGTSKSTEATTFVKSFSFLDTCAFAVSKVEKTTRAYESENQQITFSRIPAVFEEKAIDRATVHNRALDIIRNGDFADFSVQDTSLFADSTFEKKCLSFIQIINETEDFPKIEGDKIEFLVFNLFAEAFATVENLDDIQEIINSYASIIEKNNTLTDECKEYIYNSLVIAAYSYDYWSNYNK